MKQTKETHEKEINAKEAEIAKLNSDYEKEMNDTKETHKNEITNLNSAHEKAMKETNEKHTNAILQKKNEIKNITKTHKNKIINLNKKHGETVSQKQKTCKKEKEDLMNKISDLKNTMSQQEIEFERDLTGKILEKDNEIENMKKEFDNERKETLQQVADLNKANDEMKHQSQKQLQTQLLKLKEINNTIVRRAQAMRATLNRTQNNLSVIKNNIKNIPTSSLENLNQEKIKDAID